MPIVAIVVGSGLLASTYGYNELRCGNVGNPKPCNHGQLTASGEVFNPEIPTAAVPKVKPGKLKPTTVYLRLASHEPGTKCKPVKVNDKMNKRYRGKRGFDLTPAAIRSLGESARKTWSGKVVVCYFHFQE